MTPATFRLSDVAELITKGTTPPRSMGGFSDEGVNYIKSESLSYSGAVDTSNLVKVSPEVHQKLKRSQLKAEDILYSIAGANLGKCGIVPTEILPANTNQAVAIIRLDKSKADPRFVSFFLRNPRFVRGVLAGVAQSAQPNVNLSDIGRYELPAFGLSRQKAIGEALGSLDDKIELNRRMNETLEEMARALFRDWFVDFGPTRRQMEGRADPAAIMGQSFPPEKAATLAPLFPAKLGGDGLPEGWSKKIVSEQIHVLTGQAFKSKDYVDQGVFVLRTKNFGKNNVASRLADDVFLPENYLEKYHKFIVQPFDYHLVMVGASLGKRGLVYPHMLPALRNQNMWCFRARSGSKVTQVFVKYLTDFLVDRSIGLASGSARDFFRKGDFEKQKFAFGTIKIQNAFHSLCQVLLEKMAANEHENQTLAEMRDLLLPKLMSGEIHLKGVEETHHSKVVKDVPVFATDLLGNLYLTTGQEEERDAVIVAATVKALQKEDLLVGNVRVMKGVYLIKRKQALSLEGFQKEAAGPYDSALNHEIRGYARKNSWIRETVNYNNNGKPFQGNQPASKYSEVEALIEKYDLRDAFDWLALHFKGATKEWMECVATVDVAIQELTRRGRDITIVNIKADIAFDPEWKPKLDKPHFSDLEIQRAIQKLREIF